MKSSRRPILFVWTILFMAACVTLTRLAPTPTIQPKASPTIESNPPTQEIPAKVTATLTDTPIPSVTPTPEIAVRFAVIGDFGSGDSNAGDVANLVKSWNPDFIITVGDNNYPDGSAETIDHHIGQFYHEYIFPYTGDYGEGADQNRFFPTLGNHDWNTSGAQPYLDYFTLPGNERYYDFTWGPVHFFAMDSDSREPDGVGASSIQAKWLQERLPAATLPWKIVYMHHPAYSSGYHGSVDWARWPYRAWGATAVLAGHDHSYERLTIDGIPYFVNGIGGGAIYDFNIILAESQVRYNADYGAMLVEADSQEIRFQFITRQGEVIDSYQIDAESPASQ